MPIIAPGSPRPPDAQAAARRIVTDRVLIGLVLAALTAWLVRAHWEAIDTVHLKDKLALHEQVLENAAPDPYQYKLWPITRAMQDLHLMGLWLEFVFYGNTLLSLIFLVVLHHLWLRVYVGSKTALVGGLVMGALANVLFLNYWHHPYEFWGVGLYCLLLLGMARDWSLARLLPVAFAATGLVWEKHAVLAVLWGLWSLQRGRPFGKALLGGSALLVASLAVPVALRFLLGMDRDHVDGTTTWSVQPWGRVAWTMAPYILPFLTILLLRWRLVPTWVRWLWLVVPIGYAAYLSQSYILHEVRSFWLFVPVFTATFCAWIGAREAAPAPAPAAPS